MLAKIEAEFESLDLAERAARIIRSQIPALEAVYIRPTRSAYSHPRDWSWTPKISGGPGQPVIRTLLPQHGENYDGFFLWSQNRADGPDSMDSDAVREPDLIRSVLIYCLTDEEQVQKTSSLIRNLGGLGIRVFY